MRNKKYLVLKGCAGLGNRLITLMGAIRYCERTQRILYVDWADGMFDQEGQNAFTQYFELNGGYVIVGQLTMRCKMVEAHIHNV